LESAAEKSMRIAAVVLEHRMTRVSAGRQPFANGRNRFQSAAIAFGSSPEIAWLQESAWLGIQCAKWRLIQNKLPTLWSFAAGSMRSAPWIARRSSRRIRRRTWESTRWEKNFSPPGGASPSSSRRFTQSGKEKHKRRHHAREPRDEPLSRMRQADEQPGGNGPAHSKLASGPQQVGGFGKMVYGRVIAAYFFCQHRGEQRVARCSGGACFGLLPEHELA